MGKIAMPRAEYLSMRQAEVPREWWTADGFQAPGGDRRFVARCYCDEATCLGWQLAHDDGLRTHALNGWRAPGG